MSTQITTAFVQGYRAEVEHICQQKGTRLRGLLREESQSSEYDYYDYIGVQDMNAITTRHGDTQFTDTPHSRRRVGLEDWDAADLIDRLDRVRILQNPDNAYARAMGMGMGRRIDDTVIAGALGNAFSGKNGETTIALPASQKIAVDYVDSGVATASNLTVAKIMMAKEQMDADEVDDDGRVFVVNAKAMRSLISNVEISSADYNDVKALVRGTIDTWHNFRFVRTERLTLDGNGDRQCFAFQRDHVMLSIGQNPQTIINTNPMKRNATQIYIDASFGAARLQEVGVVEVACSEA